MDMEVRRRLAIEGHIDFFRARAGFERFAEAGYL
jgi:hypothetical protein